MAGSEFRIYAKTLKSEMGIPEHFTAKFEICTLGENSFFIDFGKPFK